jgi:hypothetical protein
LQPSAGKRAGAPGGAQQASPLFELFFPFSFPPYPRLPPKTRVNIPNQSAESDSFIFYIRPKNCVKCWYMIIEQ